MGQLLGDAQIGQRVRYTLQRIDLSGKSLVRALIVAAILASSALIAQTASLTVIGLLVAALFGVGAVILFMRHPALGLVMVIPACLIVPFEIGTGSQTAIHSGILLLGLLTGLWLLDLIAHRRLGLILAAKPALPLLLLVFVAVLAFVLGQMPWFPVPPAPVRAQFGGVGIFVLCAVAFLLTGYQIRQPHWLAWMAGVFIAIGTVYIIVRLMPGTRWVTRVPLVWYATGSLSWVWLVALAFSQALFNDKLHRVLRVGLLLLVAATVYVAFFREYEWKSGWMPCLVVIAAILAARSWRLAVSLAVLGIIPAIMLASRAVASDEYSYSTRLEAWTIMGQIIAKNPLLGLGPANYYFYTPLFEIRGYFVNFNSHNQYVDLVAQVGLLGLICFVWFLWRITWLAWRLRTQAPRGFHRAYVYGVLGGLAGTLVAGFLGDWVVPFVYNVGFNGLRASLPGWMFLGGLIAIARMQAAPAPPEPAPNDLSP